MSRVCRLMGGSASPIYRSRAHILVEIAGAMAQLVRSRFSLRLTGTHHQPALGDRLESGLGHHQVGVRRGRAIVNRNAGDLKRLSSSPA